MDTMEYRLLDDDGQYVTINLRLAKAVPELLEACRVALKLLGNHGPYASTVAGRIMAAETVLQAAIAKAEGG